MKNSNRSTTVEILFLLLLFSLPFIYLAYVYPQLPERVPTHFDASGTPNDYSSKGSLGLILLLVEGIALGIYLLTRYLPAIDPKRTARFSRQSFQKIGLAIVTLLTAINIIIVYCASAGRSPDVNHLLFPLLGLFFAYLGNILYSIKPNYFIGIRTPWTLESEDNWRATHRLGSKVFFVGGICLTVAALLIPSGSAVVLLMVITGIMALIPVIYSFIYFKKHPQKNV
jgi:uncharacterized membrane protein